MSKILERVNKLSNTQISVFMLGFSIILVIVGTVIWRTIGPLNMVAQTKPINIATTNPMVTDLVNQIGAEHVNVIELDVDQTGQYESIPSDTNVVFLLGTANDQEVLNLLAASDTVPVRLDRNINMMEEAQDDSTYWNSLPNVMLISKNITETLVQLQPENTDKFESNHNNLSTQIAREDIKIRNRLNSVENKLILSLGFDWIYFGRDYGFETIYLPLDAEVNQEVLVDLNRLIQEYSIDVIFVASNFNDTTLQDWASDLSVSLVTLKTTPDSDSDTFLKLMNYNTSQISNAL